jgi:AraC family transcriptional regulator
MSEQFLFSNIQGNVSRREQVADLTLTETCYPARLSLSPHAHEKACFGLVIEGEYAEEFGIKSLLCRQHTILFRPPQVVHSDRVCDSGARCLFVEVAPHWLECLPARDIRLKEPAVLVGGELERLANSLYREWREMDNVTPLVIQGLALEMIGHFYRGLQRFERRPPAWLDQVAELLRARFAEPPQLAEIARAVERHPMHIAREFRRYYRMTMGEFVRQQRIHCASERLAQSEAPLIEIALEAGFAHQAHFTTVFKRLTGLTPAQYRKLASSERRAQSFTS